MACQWHRGILQHGVLLPDLPQDHPESLVKVHIPGPAPDLPSQTSGRGLRVCIFNKYPGQPRECYNFGTRK